MDSSVRSSIAIIAVLGPVKTDTVRLGCGTLHLSVKLVARARVRWHS